MMLFWASSLDIGGVSGWRLPDTLQPDQPVAIKVLMEDLEVKIV
jgi:hypothetical protein